MIQRGLFLFFFVCLSAHAVFGHQNVLAGAKIDRVTGDFAPFVGGNQDLIQNNMVQNPAPLVGHPPMLHAKVSADASSGVYPPDERSINFYEQASKDRVPNTVYHSVSTYGEKIFAVGGLTASNTVDKSFQYFDTIELRWINLTADVPNVPTLWGHCSAVYLDYLILYGGRSDANANTPVWNTAFYVLNLVNYTEGFFTVPSNISFTIQDHTCYVSDDNSYNVGFISIGGRGLFKDATEPYDLIIHFDADTIIDPLTSSVPSYNTSACGYARFGSDGDFWIQDYENGLSQLFYFMIGGFQGFDINGDLVAIPTWSDGFILLYDALGDECYTFNIHEAPFPYFPGPRPINRYSFNTQWIYTVQKENISLANDPFVTVDTIGNADGTLVPNGLFQFTSTTPLNKDQDPILEYDGELHLGGGHFGGYARLPIPDFDNIFAFEIWFRANSSNSNATKILDIGQRFDLPPYSLASFTCGLLLNDDLTLTAYITGSKDLIVLSSLRETIENTINEIEAHPKRNAYASFVTTSSQIIPQALHHVAVNFNHRDQILQIFVDGQLEGETVLIPDTLPISKRGEFVYVGRSLNNNEAFGDFYLNGTVTEIRFYDRPLAKAEIQYSISRGPDITPLARGYHAVFEYENIVFFAGGYNPETDANLRPYNDAWSIDGSYDHYLNDPNNIVFIVDRTGPALETLEFPAFVQTEAVRLPMNRPNGHREDLYART